MNQEQRIKELEAADKKFLNSIAMQIRFHTISGLSFENAVEHIYQNAKDWAAKLNGEQGVKECDATGLNSNTEPLAQNNPLLGEQVIFVETEISNLTICASNQVTGWLTTGKYVRQTTLSEYIKELK